MGVPALAAEQKALWSFDFGTTSSAIGEGWAGVNEATRYSAATGFGIVPVAGVAPVSRNRTATVPDAVANDFVLGASWGFVADVSNGIYDVEVQSGDQLAGTSTTKTSIALEGQSAGTIQARQAVVTQTWQTTVSDGQLTIDITGEGAGGYVNAVVIKAAQTQPPATTGAPTPTSAPTPTTAPSALLAPTAVRMAHVTDASVMLRWNEVKDAKGYVVSRSDSVSGTYAKVAETTGDVFVTDAVDTTKVHYYQVQAKGGDGLSKPSAAAVSSLSSPAPVLPEDGVLTFDFGNGAVASNSVGIKATTAYTAKNRAGFIDPSAVTATDRGTADALRSDFATVGDTEFVVDLPNGDYTVDLIAGDATGATDISIAAEQMAKVQQTARTAGNYLEMSFDIAVVDGQLNLEFGGTAPNINAVVLTQKSPRLAGTKPTVWVTGDSTVQSYTSDYAPQAGWGQMLPRYLSEDVTVENKAIGGRSSKNFISQGRLDEVLRGIRPGDYLFVQFGHNDNSKGVDDRYAAPADYAEYLRTYVDGARQRGATPIIVTPVSRRSFDAATGKFNVSFPDYVAAASGLASQSKTALVDLSALSKTYLDSIGPEAALSVFLHVPAGVYPSRPSGTADDTHFQEYGAIAMARLVATGISALDMPLADEVVAAEPPAAVPAAPAKLVAGSISNAGAQLSWSAVTGADIYKVFRKDAAAGDGGWALVSTSTLPQSTVGNLAEGASYDFRVVAVNGRGDSTPSNIVRIQTKAPLYKFDVQLAGNPLMPGYTEVNEKSLYTKEIGWGFLDLAGLGGRDRGSNFDPAPNNVERDFLLPAATHQFVVDVPNGSYAVKTYNGDWIGSSKSTVLLEGKDFGASNAGKGSVSAKISQPVQVLDGQLNLVMGGDSSRLNGIEITPLLLAPTSLKADGVSIETGSATVRLSWVGTDAANYRVYRKSATADKAEALGDTTTASFTDTKAEIGLEYSYYVAALDLSGSESVASNKISVTTVDPSVAKAAVPGKPTLGKVNKNDLTLAWKPVQNALFYQVFRADAKADGSFGDFKLVGRAGTPEYTDNSVLTTIAYKYAVASVNGGGVSDQSETVTSGAVTTLVRQAERLDRAPVAVDTEKGVYLGWRMLGLDPDSIAFNVYRDGVKITDAPVTGSTNLLDADGTSKARYRISTVLNGAELWATESFTVWDAQTLDVPLQKPADDYTKDGQPYSYRASDASIGDVDGDGSYEIILKWDPTLSKDNSQAGYTGIVYVDAYKLDGTRLWRIDLGKNIRAGAHYTQFQVYDLNGDGKAEVTLKTADGTVDGAGTVIGDPRADYRNSSGYILSGPEYVTVFNGATGAAIDTIDYTPERGDVGAWGDAYGNRVDRFLAGVAYLDGEHPSVIFSRGYYTRTVVAAYDFDGTTLSKRWTFDSNSAGDEYRGQGNHQFSVADVDGDQKDEIVFGSMTIDDNGSVLYNTKLGHGDAIHVSDLDPSRPGMEVFAVHEEAPSKHGIGATFRDAATGEVLWSIPATKDTGRGAAADIDPTQQGAEAWAIGGTAAWNSPVGELHAADGALIGTSIPAANFLTWWDGDLLREITDHEWTDASRTGVPTISKWDWTTNTSKEIYRAAGTLTNNDTKGSPSLQADLFGDWREEIVTRLDDSSALRIATTVDLTDHRLRTLQSDPVYRLGVAWQNTAYNQPPHTSYFLGVGMTAPKAPSIAYTGSEPAPGAPVNPEPSQPPTELPTGPATAPTSTVDPPTASGAATNSAAAGSSSGSELSATGASGLLPMLAVGVVVLLVGALLMRRRRSHG
ncbi:G-D-S-L family lipolytic protein [Arthrobacter glacialis]|uniref:G-D-S-L family lipolytic protein n=2 Tax=Arthrobacter glacialis TaxID=1664 RepID=A0A2S4A139_ARTGL|nr:G-D-S-L family lipolytic protein [Arthrobacter glacialis]POH75226.1 G-D-S-L family lipolytic protein [Arthrobacter glacialis]